MNSFSQSTQAWKLTVEKEDRQRYADKFKMNVVEKDPTKCVGGDADDVVDLSADIL